MLWDEKKPWGVKLAAPVITESMESLSTAVLITSALEAGTWLTKNPTKSESFLQKDKYLL